MTDHQFFIREYLGERPATDNETKNIAGFLSVIRNHPHVKYPNVTIKQTGSHGLVLFITGNGGYSFKPVVSLDEKGKYHLFDIESYISR